MYAQRGKHGLDGFLRGYPGQLCPNFMHIVVVVLLCAYSPFRCSSYMHRALHVERFVLPEYGCHEIENCKCDCHDFKLGDSNSFHLTCDALGNEPSCLDDYKPL